MNDRTVKMGRAPAAVLVAVLGLLLLTSGAAWAQAPVAQVTMYEVVEALQFKKPIKHKHQVDPQVFARRFAEAALLGNSVVSFGDPVFSAASYIGAGATSNVNINPASRDFGTGPIRGEFDLLTDWNGGSVDHLSDLAVVASGKIDGTLDLRPALNPTDPQPIAPVSGNWKLTTVHGQRGQFQGAFLIAADLSSLHLPGDWYIQPDALNASCVSGVSFPVGVGVSACQLDSTEYVLGIPLTKLVLFLFTGGK